MEAQFEPTQEEQEDLEYLNSLTEDYLDETGAEQMGGFQEWLAKHFTPLAEQYRITPLGRVFRQETPPPAASE